MFSFRDEMCYIMTTRFNMNTLRENRSYLENYRKKHPNPKTECVYGTPCPIKENIPLHAKMFVIEMLNISSPNHPDYPGKIVGIGILRNTMTYRKIRIYENDNYNRYSYQGNSRIYIDKSTISEEEQSFIRRMEYALFKGPRHQKRSDGITILPLHVFEAFPNFTSVLTKKHT